MTEEVKKRIEDINNGIVPEGYKKTKIGVVPIEWENTKFSDVFQEKINRTDDFEKYPLYSLTIENGVVPKSERYERSHLVKKDDVFKIVEKDDFVYNPMNVRFGAVARYKDYNPVCVSGYYDVFCVKEMYSKEYMENFLLSEPMINYYNVVSTGSLKEKQRVHFSQFIDFKLPIPSLEEQKRIAEILSTQNKIILNQERKVEELKNLKRAYLTKMFPQKGSKYPEIRFKGFTDAWEQRKFSEFVKNVAKKNKDNLDYEPYAVTNDRGFIAQKEAHDDFGYMSDVDRSAYNIVPPKSFAYNPARINVGSLGYYEGNENVIVSSLYEVFQTEDFIDDKFLLHWLKSDAFPRWIEKLQEGSVRLYFYFDKLIQCQIMLPSLEEQKRISEFLDNLDNTITLHQRKLEAEKKKKKALMQLLLTGKVRVKV